MAENEKNTNSTHDEKDMPLVSDSAGANIPNVAPIVIPDDAKN